jgi:FHS family L-fucose permease-like MFS transporter
MVKDFNSGTVGAGPSPLPTKPVPYTSDYKAFSLMSGIFFVMGFVTCLNDVLIPHLKASFNLNYAQAMMVQSVWFATVFLVSLPAGWLVSRYGYKRSAVVSLLVGATGLAAMWPAASIQSYGAFLAALFVVASGTTLMQVVLNPYITLLGSPEKAASRLSLAQALNSLGTFLAPFFGGLLILSAVTLTTDQIAAMSAADAAAYRLDQANAVRGPYIGIAIFLLLMAVTITLSKLPKVQSDDEGKDKGSFAEALKFRQLRWGILAIFCYVGAEVTIGSFMTNYISLPHIGNMSESAATTYVALYWGGAMVGRLIGAAIMTKISARQVLGAFAITNMALLAITMTMGGWASVISVVAIGFFNSIMFASIFTLGVEGTGRSAGPAASILIMAEIGGAIVPYVQGIMADRMGVQMSYILPLICYICILAFAAFCFPMARKQRETRYATA